MLGVLARPPSGRLPAPLIVVALAAGLHLRLVQIDLSARETEFDPIFTVEDVGSQTAVATKLAERHAIDAPTVCHTESPPSFSSRYRQSTDLRLRLCRWNCDADETICKHLQTVSSAPHTLASASYHDSVSTHVVSAEVSGVWSAARRYETDVDHVAVIVRAVAPSEAVDAEPIRHVIFAVRRSATALTRLTDLRREESEIRSSYRYHPLFKLLYVHCADGGRCHAGLIGQRRYVLVAPTAMWRDRRSPVATWSIASHTTSHSAVLRTATTFVFMCCGRHGGGGLRLLSAASFRHERPHSPHRAAIVNVGGEVVVLLEQVKSNSVVRSGLSVGGVAVELMNPSEQIHALRNRRGRVVDLRSNHPLSLSREAVVSALLRRRMSDRET